MLSFAAERLWHARDEAARIVTHEAYEAFGGVVGAITTQAENTFMAFSLPERRAAKAILLALITPEGALRRSVDIEELIDEIAIEAATDLAPISARPEAALDRETLARTFDRLVAARLIVTFDDDAGSRCELVHEELLVRWERLSRWFVADRERASLAQEITQAAELWRRRGSRSEELWRGEALAEARAILGEGYGSKEVRDFVGASSRHERQSRWRRRLRQSVFVVAVVILAAIAGARWAGDLASRQGAPRAAELAGEREGNMRWTSTQVAKAWEALARGGNAEAKARLHTIVDRAPHAVDAVRALWWKLRTRRIRVWSRGKAPSLQAPSLQAFRRLHTVSAKRVTLANDLILFWNTAGSIERSVVCPAGPPDRFAVDVYAKQIALVRGLWLLLWDRHGRRLRDIFALPFAARDLAFDNVGELLVDTEGGILR